MTTEQTFQQKTQLKESLMPPNTNASILLSHPTGNSNVRAVLQQLHEHKMLAAFATTVSMNPDAGWFKWIPPALRNELLRRKYSLPAGKVYSHPWLELARMAASKAGWASAIRHEKGWACVDRVYQNLDGAVAKKINSKAQLKINAVYAYEDAALETFANAKKNGLTTIYDLPIAYWKTVRELLMEEAERLPAWRKTLGGGTTDSQEKLDRKTRELQLADIVIAPGKFVMDSLPVWTNEKIKIVSPFGSPQVMSTIIKEDQKKDVLKPLRVLFAGSMGQRKGLADLFRAIKLLNTESIELVVMGAPLDSMSFYRNQLNCFTYEHGRPHAEVLALMRTCDVFCLPSIVEGRALVMQEAMSQGLPIIITPNTGGEDLVIDGSGFLVPIRSAEAIAEKLEWFLANRSQIAAMREVAKAHAATYSWEQYGRTIIDRLKQVIPCTW
jgi:glycosyltransferase involved in cell wall biosynthesis